MLTPHLLKILIYVKFWHVNIFNMFLSVWNCDNYISLACNRSLHTQSKEKLKKNGCCVVCVSVMCSSLLPHGLQSARFPFPWHSPGKNTGVGSHALLQGIVPTQGSNLCLLHPLHWQVDSLPRSHQGSSFSHWQVTSLVREETHMEAYLGPLQDKQVSASTCQILES